MGERKGHQVVLVDETVDNCVMLTLVKPATIEK